MEGVPRGSKWGIGAAITGIMCRRRAARVEALRRWGKGAATTGIMCHRRAARVGARRRWAGGRGLGSMARVKVGVIIEAGAIAEIFFKCFSGVF
jgi:hypothetical protein